jgi:hypothetical protein
MMFSMDLRKSKKYKNTKLTLDYPLDILKTPGLIGCVGDTGGWRQCATQIKEIM